MQQSDSSQLLAWRNLEHVRAFMYTDHVITSDEHEAWMCRVLSDPKCQSKVFEYRNRPIGIAHIVQISPKNQSCSWSFHIGETNALPGAGAYMEFLLLEAVFDEMKMRKLYCEVLAFNESTIRLHKRFGFEEEGILRRHVLKNGEFVDVVCLALFNEQWDALKSRLSNALWH